MNIEELLRDDEAAILDEAAPGVARLPNYGRDGADATRRRVAALYRQVARAVRARDLDGLLAHAGRVARERHAGGFDLAEVEAAFALLEGAIARRAVTRLDPAELAWGLGMVATAVAHARSELNRTFVWLSAGDRPATVDLTPVFSRSATPGRAAEELVFPV
jgi:hypothetical protein